MPSLTLVPDRAIASMQARFSDVEYAKKKQATRRDRFLAEIEAGTPSLCRRQSCRTVQRAMDARGRLSACSILRKN